MEMSEQDKRRHRKIGEQLAKESECTECVELAHRLKLAVEALNKASTFRDNWHWDVNHALREIEGSE